MIIVPIKENETIDKALKKFKKKFEKTGIVTSSYNPDSIFIGSGFLFC
jgi:ribosomal protein S21